MATGRGMLELAHRHIGEHYENVQVPKNNPNWRGPWDCAEFMSWLVFQDASILYGCLDDNANPAVADAYTGAWKMDSERLGIRIPVEKAAATVGAIVLRYPPAPGTMGHIAICDGQGNTVEAKGKAYGVVQDTVHGRRWDTGVLIPDVHYDTNVAPLAWTSPTEIYFIGAANMDRRVVRDIEQALLEAGYDPGPIDGIYGTKTAAAVAAFQAVKGLVVDGEVGPQTAKALGVTSLALANAGPVGAAPSTMSCSDGWLVTGYYTPGEDQFDGPATQVDVRGHGADQFPADFLKHVKIEGWGLTRHGWYLGWDQGWMKNNAPLNARGGQLQTGSLAVDHSVIPLGTRVQIPNLASPWDQQVFVADDTGGGIEGKHVDVYCGAGPKAREETLRITASNRRVCLG